MFFQLYLIVVILSIFSINGASCYLWRRKWCWQREITVNKINRTGFVGFAWGSVFRGCWPGSPCARPFWLLSFVGWRCFLIGCCAFIVIGFRPCSVVVPGRGWFQGLCGGRPLWWVSLGGARCAGVCSVLGLAVADACLWAAAVRLVWFVVHRAECFWVGGGAWLSWVWLSFRGACVPVVASRFLSESPPELRAWSSVFGSLVGCASWCRSRLGLVWSEGASAFFPVASVLSLVVASAVAHAGAFSGWVAMLGVLTFSCSVRWRPCGRLLY